MRQYIQETVGHISREDRRWIRAAPKTNGKADGITAENRWKKKCGEESAKIALRTSTKIELRASGIDDHAPLGNADEMGQEIAEQDSQKSRKGNTMNGLQQKAKREEIAENAENDKRGEPTERDKEAAAGFVFGMVGADHGVRNWLGTENFVDLGGKLKIEGTNALDTMGVEIDDNFVPDIGPVGMVI